MRRDAPVAHFSMGCADAGSGAPAGGRAPTECGGMGVLERIAEAREGLEPWRAATAAAELAAAPRDGAAACERMRTFLRDMRQLLARTPTTCATPVRGEVPAEVAMLQREISGRLHETLWLVRQAARRAGGVADTLEDTFSRGAEIEAMVETLRGIGERTAKLVAAQRAA